MTIRNNEVDIGVRVEVPNAVMDHLTKYQCEAKWCITATPLKIRCVPFCMNPGGIVKEEHYDGISRVVNGHSYAEEERRTGNTNFAPAHWCPPRFTEPFDRPIDHGDISPSSGICSPAAGLWSAAGRPAARTAAPTPIR